MRGLYTEKVEKAPIPFEELVREILRDGDRKVTLVEQFCDDGEGKVNRYNVYKIYTNDKAYVLKKSDAAEIHVYEKLLNGQSLPVPECYGAVEWNGRKWILLAYAEGTDLRDFTEDMAYACAMSITQSMNRYWQEKCEDFARNKLDDRFERYWERINRRAKCLKGEPVLKQAYEVFLTRQLTEPRTLCNGDFLQFNALYNNEKVTIIDWAFGGIMPYALDIARLIAHGTEDKRTFPFYMTDAYREIYVQQVYEKLEHKPEYERYLLDIKLALLNECIEFIERELNDVSRERDHVFEYYYEKAQTLAEEIIRCNLECRH